MNLDEAVRKLELSGFVVEKIGGKEQRLLGGTARSDDEDGADYKGAFSIYRCEGGWALVMSGPGSDASWEVPSLEEAVELAREELGPAS